MHEPCQTSPLLLKAEAPSLGTCPSFYLSLPSCRWNKTKFLGIFLGLAYNGDEVENVLFYLAASNSSLFRLQLGPYHICATTKLVLSAMTPVSSVKAHPTPIRLDSGSTAAVPLAPSRHRARFKAAVAEAPRLENTSTKYVVTTPWIDVAAQPRKNVHTMGTEM